MRDGRSRRKPRLSIAAASLAALVGLAAALPLAASAGPSLSQLNSALGGQRARARALSSSVGALGQLIGRLDAQVTLIEGRRVAVEAELARDQTALVGLRASRASEYGLTVRLHRRLATAQLVLSRELVTTYESQPPDTVSVVLAAHGFADLLDRLELARFARQHEELVIAQTGLARASAEAAVRRLAGLEVRQRTVTTGVAAQARAVAAIGDLLASRRAALEAARAAHLAALGTTRQRSGALVRALAKLKAELAAGASRAYGDWAIPAAIVTCESGGQNLPPNSAGASGYYQFLPSTWAGLGGSTPAAYLAPKAEQDKLAGRLWDSGRGAGNWDCAAIVGII